MDAERMFAGALHDAGALSAAGSGRRALLRAELTRAVVARRRRRVAVRAGAAVALLLLVGVWLWLPLPAVPPHAATPAVPACTIARLRDDSTVLARLAVPRRPIRDDVLVGDDELLELLATADRRTGLIRTAGRVLLTAKVTDELSE